MLQIKKSNTVALALAAVGVLCTPAAIGQSASEPAAAASASAAKPRKSSGARSNNNALRSSSPVTVNFINADIEAVTRAMGAMLNRQFIVDPRVKGQITVYSEQPMLVREAYLNYLASLRGLGFTVVESAGLLKVVPEADAKLQTSNVLVGASRARGDQVVTQIFRLNHENPNNLVPVLRPLISPNNTINANTSNQTLIITDYADNLQRLGKIIAALDNPATGDVEIIGLKHGVALDMAAIVQRLAGGGTAAPGVPGAAAGAGAVSVLADARSNSLIVQTATPAKLAQVRAIVERLDRPGQGGPGGNIWVVYLKNADATRLATVLRASFANPQQGGGAGGAAVSAQPLPTSTPAPSATGTNTVAQQPLQGAAAVQTGGFIQADPSTNSLIITAAEPLYRQIRTVIDQLDSRRAQVLVESMIVKVDATKMAEMGFQWQGSVGQHQWQDFARGGHQLRQRWQQYHPTRRCAGGVGRHAQWCCHGGSCRRHARGWFELGLGAKNWWRLHLGITRPLFRNQHRRQRALNPHAGGT